MSPWSSEAGLIVQTSQQALEELVCEDRKSDYFSALCLFLSFFLYPSACLSVCLPVSPSLSLSLLLFVCLFVSVSVSICFCPAYEAWEVPVEIMREAGRFERANGGEKDPEMAGETGTNIVPAKPTHNK